MYDHILAAVWGLNGISSILEIQNLVAFLHVNRLSLAVLLELAWARANYSPTDGPLLG